MSLGTGILFSGIILRKFSLFSGIPINKELYPGKFYIQEIPVNKEKKGKIFSSYKEINFGLLNTFMYYYLFP
jgi:hypothetical protein